MDLRTDNGYLHKHVQHKARFVHFNGTRHNYKLTGM